MTSVVLVDDHELIRQGLVSAFERSGDFQVAGQAGTLAEALTVVGMIRPDVVVTDIRLPDGSGLDLVREQRKARSDIGLVVLTMYSSDDQLFAAMDAGASAFVGKDAPAADVINAARQAAVAPRSFTSVGLGEAMLRKMTNTLPRLSDREQQILVLLAEGLGVSAISGRLYISDSTTKSHIAKIYEKLGATNRAQALVTAMRMGLIEGAQERP